MPPRYSWEDHLVGSWVGLALFLFIVGLLLLAWLVAKALELVLRAFVVDPWNKALWVAGGSFLLSAALALITGGNVAVLNALAYITGAALLLVAKVIEIYHEQLFLQEWNKDTLTHALLHDPWWSLEAPVSSNGHEPALTAHA